MTDEETLVCHCCGKPLAPGTLAWDIEEPDPLAYLSPAEREERIGVQTEQMVTVRGMGNFIRVILPVPVEHDREATFGVWLCITEPKEYERIIAAAHNGREQWIGLRFAGRLCSAVQPWPEIFGAWAQAEAPGERQVARLVHSVDPALNAVLTQRWPIDLVRERGDHIPGQMTGPATPNPYKGRWPWSRPGRR
jgi:hypothetical protein